MNIKQRTVKNFLRVMAVVAILLPALGCGPGTVYVGVVGPGPWVGYPPGGAYGGYPGVYGRPWYAPDDEAPDLEESAVKDDQGSEAG